MRQFLSNLRGIKGFLCPLANEHAWHGGCIVTHWPRSSRADGRGGVVETQRTLARPVEVEGIGLHSGSPARLTINPAGPDQGIVFVRRDQGRREIPAAHASLQGSSFATTLASGGSAVSTVEHLLSALHGLGGDSARIDGDGPEVPIRARSGRP